MNKNLLFILIVLLIPLAMFIFSKPAHADENAPAATNPVTPPESSPIIVFQTTQGNIEIKLWPNVAPKTCENMIGLINKGYYNGITFHRVIKNFMLQGGDPTGTGRGGESIWGGEFEDEISPNVQFDRKGLLAMANAGPNTNGSQFFITVAETSWLNGRHTIFGEVINGYDIIEKISLTPTDEQDRPLEKQVIKKTYLKK